MKYFLVSIYLFCFLGCAVAQFPEPTITCKIVGGAGIIKTNCHPNNINSLRVIDERLYSAFARDTISQILYVYDRTLPIYSRWRPFLTTPSVSNFDTSRIIWNGGNYDYGGIKIGAIENATISFITNNTVRGTWSGNGGLAIGQYNNEGHDLYVKGSTHVGSLQLNEPLPATNYTQMLLRNPNDGYVYKSSINDVVSNSYLQNTDTLTAWAGRVVNLTQTTHDVVINSRVGNQYNTDSIVFNLDFIPLRNQEINIMVSGNAKLWIMDLILKTKGDAASNNSFFDEGNEITGGRSKLCIEFGGWTNNPNYNGFLFITEVGRVWKVSLKYNSLDKRWLVTKTGTN